MNNPFDYTPHPDCDAAYDALLRRIECLRQSASDEDRNLIRELEEGKMLGVLIATDELGNRHTLYAFSGQLGGAGFHHPLFVGPVFDYLEPDGYFKLQEVRISDLNRNIAEFTGGELIEARKNYEKLKNRLDREIERYREACRESKVRRDASRVAGMTDERELARMIRESQFEKAELKRRKRMAEVELQPFASRLRDAENQLKTLCERRKNDSEALQRWLFDNFTLLNARGESRSLSDIFTSTSLRVPPSGAGECCAPKLLQAAYRRSWRPVAMAEYWYGRSKGGEVRMHGQYYPACRGKCLPVLGWMLRGLEVVPPLREHECEISTPEPTVIYENGWFCVVDKPAGMLSVPGKGTAVSVQRWLEERYGPNRNVKVAHRLDRDTSGLLLAAFGPESYATLQSLFAKRDVRKTYIALLEGDYRLLGLPSAGRIELPLSPDWLDRPRQRVDVKNGKEAVTDYEFLGVKEGNSIVCFHPHTGRTHQLRVHAASAQGLGMPIVGDSLYGRNKDSGATRLHLHAHHIAFTFPLDARPYAFTSPLPF